MRAYINRTEECKKILIQVDESMNTGEDYLDVAHWLYDSGESFHGELICDNHVDSFIFKDSRIPEFTLPLQCVNLDN